MAKAPATEEKPAKPKSPPKELAELGLQAFTMDKIHRSQLTNAEYNPRFIGDNEKRKLKAGLKKHGMVTPITWNKRTGHIVGGHQRLSLLDSLAGTKDYNIDVAAIDVDETKETEINILLNNPEAQGTWDFEKLGGLLKMPTLDLAGAGFDGADVFQIFGDNLRRQNDEASMSKLTEQLSKMREVFESNARAKSDRNFYLVVVFKDGTALDAFIAKHKLVDNRYQSGEQIDEMLSRGADLSASPQADPASIDPVSQNTG